MREKQAKEKKEKKKEKKKKNKKKKRERKKKNKLFFPPFEDNGLLFWVPDVRC